MLGHSFSGLYFTGILVKCISFGSKGYNFFFDISKIPFCTSILFGRRVTDMETGYKMFKRRILKNIQKIKSNSFNFEAEFTAKVLKSDFRFREVHIDFNPRKYSEGKKINWIDGIIALLTLIKFRFLN